MAARDEILRQLAVARAAGVTLAEEQVIATRAQLRRELAKCNADPSNWLVAEGLRALAYRLIDNARRMETPGVEDGVDGVEAQP